jgi:glycosyltransferase involved in cell wall biosynthesis
MKKVLFVIDSLASGGAEKSLVSLLSQFDYASYEVDLLMFSPDGLYLPLLPKEINVLEAPEYVRKQAGGIAELLLSGSFKTLALRVGASLSLRNPRKAKRLHGAQINWVWMSRGISGLGQHYDVAIAYSQGTPTYFVAEKIQASKKLCWVNTDYKAAHYDPSFDVKYYEQYDNVIAVSDYNKEVFMREMPVARHKTEVVYDIVSPGLITSMAAQDGGFADGFGGIRIVTIGRLVEAKGYDMAIEACRRLVQDGYNVRWYVIGEGVLRAKLEKMIADYRLEDSFHLLGTFSNPYVFLNQCDIYVQPSRFEGFGLAIAEARILHKPIVATDFTVVHNQLRQRDNGLIVEMSADGVYAGVKEMIDNEHLRRRLAANLRKEQAGTEAEIDKVYALIES